MNINVLFYCIFEITITKVVGLTLEEGVRKRKYNREITELFGEPDLAGGD